MKYMEESPKLFNTNALASQLPDLSKKFFEAYAKYRENESKAKSRENERLRARDVESLKAEAFSVGIEESNLNAMKTEVQSMEMKID